MGLVGDVVVVPGEPFRLDFYKGPGEPMLRLEHGGAFGSASGALAGPGWSGRVSEAPDALRPWFALRSVFNGPDTGAARNPNQPAFRVNREYDRQTLIAVDVQFVGRGEEFQFRFD